MSMSAVDLEVKVHAYTDHQGATVRSLPE